MYSISRKQILIETKKNKHMRKIKFENLKNGQIFLIGVETDKHTIFLIYEIAKVKDKNNGIFQILSNADDNVFYENFEESLKLITHCKIVKVSHGWRNIGGEQSTIKTCYLIGKERFKKMVENQRKEREKTIPHLQKQLVGFNSAMRRAGFE
jgi:hypothetical protein